MSFSDVLRHSAKEFETTFDSRGRDAKLIGNHLIHHIQRMGEAFAAKITSKLDAATILDFISLFRPRGTRNGFLAFFTACRPMDYSLARPRTGMANLVTQGSVRNSAN